MHYFIYETTNLINGKKYRGCHSTKNINDGYIGSGVALKKAVKKYGKTNFLFQIIYLCSDLEDMIEKEKIFVDENWVQQNDTYNLQTGGLNYGILNEESKKKISNTLRLGYASGKYKAFRPKGIDPWNKGKTGIYNEETLKKMSETRKGRPAPNKGKKGKPSWNKGMNFGPMSPEEKEKRSKALKKHFAENGHHLQGVEPWNKGKKTNQIPWNKGKEEPKVKCSFCGKEANRGNISRWHNENCKARII